MPDVDISTTVLDSAAQSSDYSAILDAIAQSSNALIATVEDVQMILIIACALLFVGIGVMLASIIANTLRG